tara:strand:+ start:18738 stop:20162 length:1425 start_codon:yes stop_codon:yes gene_type:complete
MSDYKPQNICMIGTGYVGLVSGTIFADWGNNVVCVDCNESKIDYLNQGNIPIYEPGLSELVKKNVKSGKLKFTTDTQYGVGTSDLIFICVGTPPKKLKSGEIDSHLNRANLCYVAKVARDVATHMNGTKIIIDKSTVPVRTGEKVAETIKKYATQKGLEYHVVSNPEFLREGCAVFDCENPDRIAIGYTGESEIPRQKMRQLYSMFSDKVVEGDIWSVELSKLGANGYLAMSISFINLLSRVCDKTGADIEKVAEIMRLDKRIGKNAFLSAGLGFGGSCFPKDVRALYSITKDLGLDPHFLRDVLTINDTQVNYFLDKIEEEVWTINDKIFSVLGLAFKDNTDDIRESRAIEVVKELLGLGAKIRTYDPKAMDNAKNELLEWYVNEEKLGTKDDFHKQIEFCHNYEQAVTETDVLIIATEWPEFREINLSDLRTWMIYEDPNINKPLWIFEGKQTFDLKDIIENEFIHYCVGRP